MSGCFMTFTNDEKIDYLPSFFGGLAVVVASAIVLVI